jgi:hypothetical protein
MKHSVHSLLAALLLTGCLGQGKRQAQRPERIHDMPTRETLANEKPKQIAARPRAGERVEDLGTVLCAMVTPSQNLAESRLKKALHLTNGPDIYPTVAALLDQPEVVERRVKDIGADWASLIWKGNPAADAQAFTMEFASGTTVLELLQEIAKRRSERVTQSTNYTVITPTTQHPMRPTYRQGGDKSELGAPLNSIIYYPLCFREAEPAALEEFINYKLQGGGSRPATAFNFTMTEGAKKRAENINVIGLWVYTELFEALGFVADLRWTVEGKNIKVQEPQ